MFAHLFSEYSPPTPTLSPSWISQAFQILWDCSELPAPTRFFFFFLVAPFPVLGSSGSMESQPLDHREFPLNSFSFLECRPTFIFPFRDFTGCVEDSFPRAWAIKVTDFFKAISDVKKPSKTRPSGRNHPQLLNSPFS